MDRHTVCATGTRSGRQGNRGTHGCGTAVALRLLHVPQQHALLPRDRAPERPAADRSNDVPSSTRLGPGAYSSHVLSLSSGIPFIRTSKLRSRSGRLSLSSQYAKRSTSALMLPEVTSALVSCRPHIVSPSGISTRGSGIQARYHRVTAGIQLRKYVQEDDHRPVRPAVNSDGSARVLDLPIAHHIAKSPFTSVVIATRPLCSSASPNRDKSHAPICRPDQLKFSQRCPVADRVPRYSKSMTNPRGAGRSANMPALTAADRAYVEHHG